MCYFVAKKSLQKFAKFANVFTPHPFHTPYYIRNVKTVLFIDNSIYCVVSRYPCLVPANNTVYKKADFGGIYEL